MTDEILGPRQNDNYGVRAAAALRGDRTYTTGLACRRGHVGARQTSNGACIQCVRPKIARQVKPYETEAVCRWVLIAEFCGPHLGDDFQKYMSTALLAWMESRGVPPERVLSSKERYELTQ